MASAASCGPLEWLFTRPSMGSLTLRVLTVLHEFRLRDAIGRVFASKGAEG